MAIAFGISKIAARRIVPTFIGEGAVEDQDFLS